MWRRKPGFDVCSGAGSARGGHAHLVARLYCCTRFVQSLLPRGALALLHLFGWNTKKGKEASTNPVRTNC